MIAALCLIYLLAMCFFSLAFLDDWLRSFVLVQRELDKSDLRLSYSRHSMLREICHVKRPWGSAPDPGVF